MYLGLVNRGCGERLERFMYAIAKRLIPSPLVVLVSFPSLLQPGAYVQDMYGWGQLDAPVVAVTYFIIFPEISIAVGVCQVSCKRRLREAFSCWFYDVQCAAATIHMWHRHAPL